VDCLAGQFTAEGPIHKLVLFHPAQAIECGGHHPNLEVVTTAGEVFHLHFGIGKGAANGVADLLRLDHGRGFLEGFENLGVRG
jgi:hypothetical protein